MRIKFWRSDNLRPCAIKDARHWIQRPCNETREQEAMLFNTVARGLLFGWPWHVYVYRSEQWTPVAEWAYRTWGAAHWCEAFAWLWGNKFEGRFETVHRKSPRRHSQGCNLEARLVHSRVVQPAASQALQIICQVGRWVHLEFRADDFAFA